MHILGCCVNISLRPTSIEAYIRPTQFFLDVNIPYNSRWKSGNKFSCHSKLLLQVLITLFANYFKHCHKQNLLLDVHKVIYYQDVFCTAFEQMGLIQCRCLAHTNVIKSFFFSGVYTHRVVMAINSTSTDSSLNNTINNLGREGKDTPKNQRIIESRCQVSKGVWWIS